MAKRVLIIATDGFEQSELIEPKKALEAAGFETVVASIKTGSIKGWKFRPSAGGTFRFSLNFAPG